ncbi:putative CASP C terminal [Lyophyllum shimeji]|uniref:Protein CASP n=1 Tax=Lyophyllum shimeji TaxID=47721 RepID=A0A9P3UNT1_LYOSH|nr:putative CASP C terminal [Lyophyllum shimeji]
MSSTEHNFSGALATWRVINLSELQKTLDTQGIELVDNQKESVVGRKALADKTKEFKKLPESEKSNAFKGLLKAYQTEIDNLTKRCKASENAFFNVYKALAEAPDPYPLLEAAVDQTVKVAEAQELEAELRRTREENVELRKRVSDFSVVENAKKKSDARVEQLEQKMEEMIQEKVAQKENELNATYDERLRNYAEREQDLQRQIALTKNQLRDLRTSNDSNQAKLMNHSQRQDQEVVSKLAEVDMIVADLERANGRVATVERRNEMLRAEIEAMRSGSDASDRVKSLETQVSELEGGSERMTRALEAQKALTSEIEAAAAKKTDELSKEIQKKVAEVDQLKQKMKQYSDYDEIKRELEIMKYVEFAGLDEDADGDAGSIDGLELQLPNPNAEKANDQKGNSLEALLATKNKRILEELTKFRILHGELEESLQTAQDQLKNMSSELEKQKALNEKLENDLASMNKHKPNGDATPSDSGLDVLAGLELNGKSPSDSASRGAIPFTSSADTSILPIVTSQRDRFRQRNAELEDELRKQFQIISELRIEIKSLQSDNLKLYEKVRYMQSYREEAGSRPPTSQLDPLPALSSGRFDDLSKYHARYEEAMNPFEAFRGREATRAYDNLNPVERGVLVLTRSILGNRRARTFFIIYALALHVLVLYSSYGCAATSPTQLQKQPSPF